MSFSLKEREEKRDRLKKRDGETREKRKEKREEESLLLLLLSFCHRQHMGSSCYCWEKFWRYVLIIGFY